ncbi:MAG TPA: hypothetical protein VGM82_19720 [Gemmatimonadaceae bacterium]
MMLRRLRALVTAAVVAGSILAIALGVAASLITWSRSKPEPLYPILADIIPFTFVMGASQGALFALFIMLGERRRIFSQLSDWRFRVWGALAAAIPSLVVDATARMDGEHVSLKTFAYTLLLSAGTGAMMGPSVLRFARRARAGAELTAEV